MLTFRNYNIADWFSFYRIAIVPILLLILWLEEREVFTWMLCISYITDAIDGYLARKLQINSARGAQLDSFGDQLTFLVSLIGLWVFENQFIRDQLFLILLAFTPYLIQMLLAFRKYGKATAFHTYLAKISAIIQAAFVLYTLFFGVIHGFFYLMIVVGILETAEEITLIFLYKKWEKDVKGVYWAWREIRTGK
ncbi:MAG: CDP-alcohol phosphatidyltransferase family protein [Saprospiraceae bacterium]|nr:CDP-alcohol phosphatidyltransferase family protein [Saprospiraceae bacterium]